jgi:transcriptional regulator with XRE-family HTH domain
MIIRQLIREARRRAGLTQAELAARAGVPQSTVGRIESGARDPSTELAERLVRAAGFEMRVGLGEPDPDTDSMIERTLRRSPYQRLRDAAKAGRFVLRGRAAMQRAKHG